MTATTPTATTAPASLLASPIHDGRHQPAWAIFDAPWYRARYAEALAQHDVPLPDDAALLAYWHAHGTSLGHAPNQLFDEPWYRAHNPDVQGGIQDGIFESGFQHYAESGLRSRMPHWLFSEERYFTLNQDLTPHSLDAEGFANGYDHFLSVGDREGRLSHRFFDPMVFRDAALQARSGIDLDASLFQQFLSTFGTLRTSWYFDPEWYLATYPGVARKIANGQFLNPLHHYLTNDTPTAFNPNPHFTEAHYAETSPDVAAIVQGGGFRNGYDHFIQFGAQEGRSPNPELDLNTYRHRPDILRDIALGRVPDAFVHWMLYRGASSDPAPQDVPSPEQQRVLALRRAETLLPLLVRAPLDFRHRGQPALSVVMTVQNGFLWTLASLAALRESYQGPIDLVIIDHGSTDDTRTLESFARGIHIIRPAQRLPYTARIRLGLDATRADITLLLDPAIQPALGSIDAALARLRQPTPGTQIGALAGQILGLDCTIHSAGSIIYRDANLEPIGRGLPANTPETGTARLCDTAANGLLFARTADLRRIQPDPTCTDRDYLLANFCLALRENGLTTLYDPAILAYDTGIAATKPTRREADRIALRDRYAPLLRTHPAGAPRMAARARTGNATRVLMLCDRVPLPHLGGRHARARDRALLLAESGCQVTLHPLDHERLDPVLLAQAFGDRIEIHHNRDLAALGSFLADHPQHFDAVWIMGTQTLSRCLFPFHAHADTLPTTGFVLEIDALASSEQRGRRRLHGQTDHAALQADLKHELREAWFCQAIVAANTDEAALIRSAGYDNVTVLPCLDLTTPPGTDAKGFKARKNLLCAAPLHQGGDASHDGLDWFVHTVLPKLDAVLPQDVLLTIAGYRSPQFDLSPLARYRRVRLATPETLDHAYSTHRVLIAPSRFTSGLPREVLRAAAHHLPAAMNDDVAAQLGWQDGVQCLTGGLNDPDHMARAITTLYQDSQLWKSISETAYNTVHDDHDPATAQRAIRTLIRTACTPPHPTSRQAPEA